VPGAGLGDFRIGIAFVGLSGEHRNMIQQFTQQ
jgi:hypothetical protein